MEMTQKISYDSSGFKVVLTAENTIFLKVYFDNFALLDFNETWRMRCLVSNIW